MNNLSVDNHLYGGLNVCKVLFGNISYCESMMTLPRVGPMISGDRLSPYHQRCPQLYTRPQRTSFSAC